MPVGTESDFSGSVNLISREDNTEQSFYGGGYLADRVQLTEKIAENDDVFFNVIWKTEISRTRNYAGARLTGRESRLFPVLFGASNKGIGVERLMDAIVALLPSPGGADVSPLSGVVFKLDKDPIMGRMAYVRLYKEVRSVTGILSRITTLWSGRKGHAGSVKSTGSEART